MTAQLELAPEPATTKRTRTSRAKPAVEGQVEAPQTAQAANLPAVAKATPPAVRDEPQSESGMLMRMIERAVTNPDFDVDKMKELFAVRERLEANEARKAFVAALTAFKADPPSIIKNKKASFDHKTGGGKTEYEFATLAQVVAAISAGLSRHGLSHNWETEQGDGGIITVTCFLRHELGHSESTSLRASPDGSGTKNNIQAVGSTITYLQRYTLLSLTGLATKDQDSDANFTDPDECISAEQKSELIGLMREVNADVGRFLKFLKVDNLDVLEAKRFNEAKQALLDKRKAAAK